MSTNVMMPQMGESIAEGTIVRWIKKVGDAIDKDEPLFEISTDKVDAEIPSPGAGVLVEIKVKEGETVPVNSVVAVIWFSVSVPVLSLLITVVPPSVSTSASDLTTALASASRCAPEDSIACTKVGRPTGIAEIAVEMQSRTSVSRL